MTFSEREACANIDAMLAVSGYSRFNQKAGLAKAYEPFGDPLPKLKELNSTLAA